MKKSLLIIALLAAFGAQAQTANSGAQSGSNSGADSTSGAAISSQNSGNTSAIGNVNASQSNSDSRSGANSGSSSGALGNNVTLNQNVPSTQNINQTGSSSSTSTSTNNTNLSGQTTSNENVKYSGLVENRSSGGTYNVMEENVRYSGTQTIKNVPAIAMSGPASGPCTGASGGLGLAGPGWGLGLNGSAVMVDCRLRENLRVIGMAMQSLDGGANPQEKGEATVMFMDALRSLSSYNQTIYAAEAKAK